MFSPSLISIISRFWEEDMQRHSLFRSLLFVAATLTPAVLTAQSLDPVPQRFTVAAAFGGLSGATTLEPAPTADWQLGWAASVEGNYWIQPRLGVRLSGTWAQDSLQSGSLSGRGKFNKFAYDANVVLRYPLAAGSGTVVPYVLGGAGAISVHQLGSDSTWTQFAGNFGAGIEYRFSRFGIRAEGRDYIYTFDRYGYDKTQHDIAWQGGLTYSF